MPQKSSLLKCILPDPLELAKLAAALVPHDEKDRDAGFFYLEAAIKEAATLYVRTARFWQVHQNDSLKQLADAIGDASTYLAECFPEEKFRLETHKRNDSVRRYLAKQGVRLGTARAVLSNMKAFLRQSGQRYWLEHHGEEPVLSASMTQKERDEFIEIHALKCGWDEKHWNEHWPRVIEATTQARSAKGTVYAFGGLALRNLAKWKKDRKHSGGVRSLATAHIKIKSQKSA